MTEADFKGDELSHVLGGHVFKDPKLLRLSLVHRSVHGGTDSNERLEFLGDRVLGLLIAEMLYRAFPDESEGVLARRYTALVREETLAQVAKTMGLGDRLTLSKSEEESGGREKPALLGDVCEAVLGALYLDGGLETARRTVELYWSALMRDVGVPLKDAKSTLQEWVQRRGKALPVYETLKAYGPNHKIQFTVQVSVKGVASAVGDGHSKRQASQAAAQALLDGLTLDEADSGDKREQ